MVVSVDHREDQTNLLCPERLVLLANRHDRIGTFGEYLIHTLTVGISSRGDRASFAVRIRNALQGDEKVIRRHSRTVV